MRWGITNCHNTHSWFPNIPCHYNAGNFQCQCCVNVWYVLIKDLLTGQFVHEACFASDYHLHFSQNELPHLLKDVLIQAR